MAREVIDDPSRSKLNSEVGRTQEEEEVINDKIRAL